jgi:hypothetical protein
MKTLTLYLRTRHRVSGLPEEGEHMVGKRSTGWRKSSRNRKKSNAGRATQKTKAKTGIENPRREQNNEERKERYKR